MEKKKILIDTDLGDDVDDAVAIALALKSNSIEIKGITTVYKDTKLRAKMVKDLLAVYNKYHIPVYVGCSMPLIERIDVDEPPIQIENIQNEHSVDMEVDAVDFIINTVKENPETIIVEMGPQTNLAMAFLKAPEIMKHAKIIAMGGAFLSTYPEWNILCDPESVRIVTDYAENLIMIGLDVTRYLKVLKPQLNTIRESTSPLIQYLYKGMEIFMERTGYPITLHDALLIVYLIDEKLIELVNGDYTVELNGLHTRGTMVHKNNYYEIEEKVDKKFFYANNINVNAVMELIMKNVFSI